MLDAGNQVGANDIAIVGMAVRVPGATTVEQFWNNLKQGVESIRDLSDDELLASGEDPARLRDDNYIARTADLAQMEMFDAEFFGLSPKDAAIMDPQHRQFLECAWEALEDAGKARTSRSQNVGVFSGCGMGSYFYFNVCSHRQLVDQVGSFLLRHTGNDKDFLATRVSYLFDLRGPSVNLQTACSTSLVAVHYANQSLLSGECDLALAGGVTIELPHRRGYSYQPGEILSPDGHCRPFDHRAAGTVFGSGAGVVVLRRLSDALGDGDNIHAVIKGSAVNNDGSSKAGYLAPSVMGQAEAVVEAQSLSGIDADTIHYIECHGTGTYLGDPIEIEALSSAFRQSTAKRSFCYVGSVKSNIGHLDTAAGVVGLIKTALTVKYGTIVPTLGFERANPSIDFAATPFKVCDRLTQWPHNLGPRRAAVNSLGVGGTNAHLIVEQAPTRFGEGADGSADFVSEPVLLMLSARNRPAVEHGALQLNNWLEADETVRLKDVALTLFEGRQRFDEWLIVAARSRQDVLNALADPTKRAERQSKALTNAGVVFMFPGGGAQHPGMGQVLYREDKEFRASIDEGLGYLDRQTAQEIAATWLGGMDRQEAVQRLLRPALQLPGILILEVALARHWMARGLRPAALIGHSMGEYAAACVSGVMSFADAVRLVRLRGELFETVQAGGMLSVPMDVEALGRLLPPELDLACVNTSSLCVVSGQEGDLERFRQTLLAHEIEARPIPIKIAAHSRLLDPILEQFRQFISTLSLRAPSIPIISNRTGLPLTGVQATDPNYWTQHLRHTVDFSAGLNHLSKDPSLIYIEVGPGRVLSSLARVHGAVEADRIIASLPHAEQQEDDRLHLSASMGRAFAAGLPVDIQDLVNPPHARMISLPTYAFQHKRYFIDPYRNQGEARPGTDIAKEADVRKWGYRPVWRRSVCDFEPGMEKQPQTWLFFVDEEGIAQALIHRLQDMGHRVVSVRRGDSFIRLNAHSYRLCPEIGRPGYDALFAALGQDDLIPARIVHMWLAEERPHVRPGSSRAHQDQEWGFNSLVELGQVWSELLPEVPVAVTVVTAGAVQVDDEPICLEKSLIFGPLLVLPKECPAMAIRLLDIDVGGQDHSSAKKRRRLLSRVDESVPQGPNSPRLESLWEEIHAPAGCEVAAIRAGRRWRQTVAPLALDPQQPANAQFREGGVYLFVAGLSEVALALAAQLAQKHKARLVLVSRHELPMTGDFDPALLAWLEPRARRAVLAICELEQLGAEVLHLCADITDQEAMAAAIAAALAHFGRIDGVFHCGGVLDDGLIGSKSVKSMERVLAPKVTGTRVLDAVLERVDVDFVVLFSSTSVDIPRAGQVDYLAANAYLNAYARDRVRSGRKVLSVHWGIWNQIGLAARAGGAKPARRLSQELSGSAFDRWIDDGVSNAARLEMTLSARQNWQIDEHRLLSGLRVLPGTGYIELLVQASLIRGQGFGATIRDLSFIRPMIFAENEPRLISLQIQLQPGGANIAISSRREGEGEECEILHATALLAQGCERQDTNLNLDAIEARCLSPQTAAMDGVLVSAQEEHLRFGPRWKVLRSVALGSAEALAILSLSDEFAGDLAEHPLHPALFDIATGFALELSRRFRESGCLWVPASYGEIIVYKPLPSTVISWARLVEDDELGEDFACFDVTLAAPDGSVLVEVRRFAMCRARQAFDETSAGLENRNAVVVREDRQASPALKKLQIQVRAGINPEEGFEALTRALSMPDPEIIVSSLDLQALSAFLADPAQDAREGEHAFERPQLDHDYVGPTNPVEEVLSGFWRQLLGVERVGVTDDFFALGGHSLIAVRLFRMIKTEFGVDLPISTLFDAPTIAQCAARIGPSAHLELGQSPVEVDARPLPHEEFVHLVLMDRGPEQGALSPLFVCAGMFGNVLNLRHLARGIGVERPVYGLQARGLYGDREPHYRFEDMAADYICEIRKVQPHGPYLLAGYSGGGLTALEIAHQLAAAGEEILHVALLDTPQPRQPMLSLADRAAMKAQDLKRHQKGYISKWLQDRRNSRHQLSHQRKALTSSAVEGFDNVRVELAFRAAANAYQVKSYAGAVTLFRPRPVVFYRLSKGRCLQENRNILLHDNGWGKYIGNLAVVEVSGDHDSMVLDPHVRALAERLHPTLRTREEAVAGFGASSQKAPQRAADKQVAELVG
ncbi:MAG: type I polyketide synthase [Pseudorhizobium sp.]